MITNVFLSPRSSLRDRFAQSQWQKKGYAMKTDARLDRTLFTRYEVRSVLSFNKRRC